MQKNEIYKFLMVSGRQISKKVDFLMIFVTFFLTFFWLFF